MGDRARWSVGQTVLYLPSYAREGILPMEVTVAKIGRTLVHVPNSWGSGTEGYDIETGHSRKDFGGRIVTPEDYAEEQARKEALNALRVEFHMSSGAGWTSHVPASAWEEVLAVLRAVPRD